MSSKLHLLLLFAASGAPLLAQDVIGSGSSAAQPAAGAAGTTLASPFLWGPLTFHPRFTYRLTYADGIHSQPGVKTNSYIHNYSPGISVAIGLHWTADYSPTWTVYSNHTFRDFLSHTVRLAGGTTYRDLTLSASETYSRTSSLRVETGRQTRQQTSATALGAIYRLGDRTSLDGALNQSIQYIAGAPDPYETSFTGLVHFEPTPHLDVAAGSGFGFVRINPGPDMKYIRPSGSLTWKPGGKLSLSLNGGSETRKYASGGATDLDSPFYGATLTYVPVETTTLNLGGTRGVSTSYFANSVTRTRNWHAGLRQRLLGKLTLTSELSDERTSYLSAIANPAPGTIDDILATGLTSLARIDTVRTFNVGLSTPLFQRTTLSATYQYSRNASNNANFAFSSKQLSFSAGISF